MDRSLALRTALTAVVFASGCVASMEPAAPMEVPPTPASSTPDALVAHADLQAQAPFVAHLAPSPSGSLIRAELSSAAASGVTPLPAAPGTAQWSHAYGSRTDDFGAAVAIDATGNVYATGYFSGTIDLGCGALTPTGTSDMYLAKYLATGACAWSTHVGGTGDQFGAALALDATGLVYVGGGFSGTTNFGAGPIVSAGGIDAFVAAYTSAGALAWAKGFGGTADDYANGVAASGADLVVAGSFGATVSFGGSPLRSAGDADVFVVKLVALTGAHQWSFAMGGPTYDAANAVAIDGSGRVVVAGAFSSSVDFGGGALASAGGYDAFVATYASSGAFAQAMRLGAAGDDASDGLAVDAANGVHLTGYFQGSVNFGGGAVAATGTSSAYVASYDSRNVYASTAVITAAGATGASLSLESNGDVVVAGEFSGAASFGGGVTATSAGTTDFFVARYTQAGACVWARGLGGQGSAGATSIATTSSGDVVVTGVFQQSIDFGGGSVVGAGGNDVAFFSLSGS